MKIKTSVLFLSCLVFSLSAADKRLSFEQAFLGKGESLTKPLPAIIGWLDDRFYLERVENRILRIDALSGRSRILLDASQHDAVKQAGFNLLAPADRSLDWSRLVFSRDDRISCYDPGSRNLREFKAPGPVQNPTLSPDGNKVAFTSRGNLFLLDLAAEKISALTADGSDVVLNGYASWVYYEEILGRAGRYRAFWWSPDSRRIVFMRFDQQEVPLFSIYDSKGDYGSLEQTHYPKPGYPNPRVKLGVVDANSGKLDWIPFQDETEHYLAFPAWVEDSKTILFQWLNRGQDHLRILAWDCTSVEAPRVVYQEKQKTWVDFFGARDLQLLDEGLLLRSSRDGWDRLYRVKKDGSIQSLTPENWTVKAIDHVDQDRGLVYFSAAGRGDSLETQLFRVDLQGRGLRQLSTAPGTHGLTFSRAASFYLDRHSALSRPPRLDLHRNDGRLVRSLGDSAAPQLAEYRLAKVERLTIPTPDGFNLPAVWYLPPDLDENRKYPVLLSVYGGPGSSSVSDSHRGFRHHFLAQEGIIVLVVDHRGSGHFGKLGQDFMHRNLGYWEMHDYKVAVRHVKNMPFVDGQKIGIEGGSYGGYVAALALTREAEDFHLGISHFPVMDWRLYDSVYTERYMDTPRENPEGYRESSVFTYLDRFKGKLRLTHGTLDDNVHLQNSLQFLDLLLDQGREIELMLYPGERHGYRGAKAAAFQRANVDFLFRHFLGRVLQE